MTSREPLVEIEVEALNRVGLNPQNLPSSLDDYIRLYLREKAEVDVSPASSSDLVGSGETAFATGIASSFLKQGAAGVGTAVTAGNIKKQTSVQEWIHWKKYALDRPDFEKYREECENRYGKTLDAMIEYIRSDKGKICCRYERWRRVARVFIVVVSTFGSCFGWIAALVINDSLIRIKGVTLPEWVIQKTFGIQSFASIRPKISVNANGDIELEY
jgi:hypothetical protein